ncbi:MAG: winged helix-turn-helix transcriptional regulator, partial [Phycisphaerales bacterium]|nr:winged helix-turn-helix transcriptional regulator [Phycisphaerales bacterium]
MPKAFIKRTASQQLAEQIHRQIEQGTWAAGDPMPSMRKLATKYHVSLATVQRAMQELGDRDIIKLLPRQGGIVQSISTAGNRTKNQIGVVVGLDPSIHIPLWWSQQIIHHAQMVLAESGYVLTLFNYMVNKPD